MVLLFRRERPRNGVRAVDERASIVVRERVVAGACIPVSMLFIHIVLFMVEFVDKKLMDMLFHFLTCFHFLDVRFFFYCVFIFRCLR